jgi:hypothetical protein
MADEAVVVTVAVAASATAAAAIAIALVHLLVKAGLAALHAGRSGTSTSPCPGAGDALQPRGGSCSGGELMPAPAGADETARTGRR